MFDATRGAKFVNLPVPNGSSWAAKGPPSRFEFRAATCPDAFEIVVAREGDGVPLGQILCFASGPQLHPAFLVTAITEFVNDLSSPAPQGEGDLASAWV